MLSGFRWWAPKSRGPWCTAPLAPPVWPPLLLNAVYICHFKICHAERVCVCVCPRFGTTRPIFPFSKINVALQLTKLWLKKVTTTTSLLHQFFVRATYGRGSSSSCGVAICYVLPVLWMTSYLHISQGDLTSPPSWGAAHTKPWAWL